MSVPKTNGIYKAFALDGSLALPFEFTIDSADPIPGWIKGHYRTENSRMGAWESELGDYPAGVPPQPERSSSYSWLAHAEGEWRVNEPPFLIRIVGTFSGSQSDSEACKDKGSDKYRTCQQAWTGIYTSDDSIHMSGSESYVVFNRDGTLCELATIALPVAEFRFTPHPPNR